MSWDMCGRCMNAKGHPARDLDYRKGIHAPMQAAETRCWSQQLPYLISLPSSPSLDLPVDSEGGMLT